LGVGFGSDPGFGWGWAFGDVMGRRGVRWGALAGGEKSEGGYVKREGYLVKGEGCGRERFLGGKNIFCLHFWGWIWYFGSQVSLSFRKGKNCARGANA